eukprot:scaffold10602_cov83-Skeletonema_marinoi.AAC.1
MSNLIWVLLEKQLHICRCCQVLSSWRTESGEELNNSECHVVVIAAGKYRRQIIAHCIIRVLSHDA